MSPIYIFFALFNLNFFFEKNGNDKTSVGLFCFLNFLLKFDKAWVHGLLHLVGYNHIRNKDYFKMDRIEKKIINLIT